MCVKLHNIFSFNDAGIQLFQSDLVRLCYAFSNTSNSSIISLYIIYIYYIILCSLGTIISGLYICRKEENSTKKRMSALMQYLFLTINSFDPLQQ